MVGAFLRLFMVAAAAGAATGRGQEVVRKWTSHDGRELQAALMDADEATVRLRLMNGTVSAVPRLTLSGGDQDYVAEWLRIRPVRLTPPDLVGLRPSEVAVETVMEDAANSRFFYRTRHFELESEGRLAGSLAREVAQAFEATHELLRVLPWSIKPRPPGGRPFRASLFKGMDSYYRAGGLPGSAGSYLSSQQRFLIPFQSLGIREVGSAYRMDADFDTHVLVHELTHQMMHFWLGHLPQWVVEGTAEYAGNLPLKNGRFRLSAAKDGLKHYLDFRRKRVAGGMPEPFPLEQLFALNYEEWASAMASDNALTQRLYFTSYLLIYYFMHLDGQGEGERFARYMDASAEPVRQMEAYEMALAEFKKQPGVTVYADGAFDYPRHLQPPTLPRELFFGAAREARRRENMKLLLDGRSEQQLMDEVRAAYQRLNIRL